MTFLSLEEVEERQPVPGFRAKFVHSDKMTVAYWTVDEGAEMPTHSHEHEQIVNLLEGRFELTVGGESREMTPGAVAIIPPEVTHSGTAKTRCRILDVFHPPRHDYR